MATRLWRDARDPASAPRYCAAFMLRRSLTRRYYAAPRAEHYATMRAAPARNAAMLMLPRGISILAPNLSASRLLTR